MKLLTWREKTVIRILLLITRMINDDIMLRSELERLATHISVAPEKTDDAK